VDAPDQPGSQQLRTYNPAFDFNPMIARIVAAA
jgi:hypothetical protein